MCCCYLPIGSAALGLIYTYAKQKQPGCKKCEANQKQHCKWSQVTKNFDIS